MFRARVFLVFVILICTSSLFAKDDMLFSEHTTPAKRFEKLKRSVDSLLEVEDTLALTYAVRMLEVAEQLDNDSRKADAYLRMGTSNMLQSNYPKARELHDKALELYSKEKDEKGIADCNLLYGFIYRNLQVFDRSVEKIMSALIFYNKTQNREKQLQAYITLGSIMVMIGKEEKGRENLFHALDLATTPKDVPTKARILLGIARSYIAQNDYPNTHKTISMLEDEFRKHKDKLFLLFALISKSETAFAESKERLSLSLSLQALKVAKEIKNEGQESHLETRIAHLYSRLDNWDSVLYYNQLALDVRKKSGRYSNISSSYINIGTSYLKRNDFPNAEENLLIGLKFALKIDHQILIQKAHRHLIQLYLSWGKNEMARQYYEENFDYVEVATKSNSTLLTSAIYDEFEKKLEKSESSNVNYWTNIALYGGIPLLLILLIFYIYNKLAKISRLKTEILSLSKMLNEAIETNNMAAHKGLSDFSILNLFEAGLIIVDEKFIINQANNGLYKFLEYTTEDLNLKPLSILLSSEDKSRIYQHIDFILQGGKLITEIQLRSLSGKTIFTRATFHAIIIDNVHLVAIFLVNISKEMEIKKKLNESIIKAEESEKQKSVFLSNVSNDIKSPIKSILSVLQNWQITAPHELRGQWLNSVTSTTNDLIYYIDNVIEFSNLHSEEIRPYPTPVNINTLINEVINKCSNAIPAENVNLSITTHSPNNTDFLVSLDAQLFLKAITQIIQNSIRNSLDGRIEIEWRKTEDKKLLITFTNYGLKISPQQLAVVQGIERPLEEAYGQRLSDTGLSLAIAKILINKLNGKIWGDQLKEKGAVIYIALDVEWISPTIWDGTKLPDIPIPNLSKNTILVAEDVDDNFSFINSLLNKTGAKIIWVKNGEEAIKKVKENPNIDLVIMDVQMPVMDGYTAARLIRIEQPFLPILVQTAFASSSEADIALKAGCDNVIHKPIQLAEFWEVINSLINQRKK